MPSSLEWSDVAARLALTMMASALLGLNRTERGRAAGLRTTMLVGLAAATAMISTNLLLGTTGKTSDSFSVIDPMRLPLGILTGMGFIGGGAILRRGDRVSGLTTAATLWMVTVLGLAFGAGQYGVGLAALALATIILCALKHLEVAVPQERHGTLLLDVADDGPRVEAVRVVVEADGGSAGAWSVLVRPGGHGRMKCEIQIPEPSAGSSIPGFVQKLAKMKGVTSVRWRTQ